MVRKLIDSLPRRSPHRMALDKTRLSKRKTQKSSARGIDMTGVDGRRSISMKPW